MERGGPSGGIHRSWLPVWRCRSNSRRRATRRNSSARPLVGMDDFGSVYREGLALATVFGGNHLEHPFEFRQGLFPRHHRRITARDCGDLRNPSVWLIAVQHDLIIVEMHASSYSTPLQARFGSGEPDVVIQSAHPWNSLKNGPSIP